MAAGTQFALVSVGGVRAPWDADVQGMHKTSIVLGLRNHPLSPFQAPFAAVVPGDCRVYVVTVIGGGGGGAAGAAAATSGVEVEVELEDAKKVKSVAHRKVTLEDDQAYVHLRIELPPAGAGGGGGGGGGGAAGGGGGGGAAGGGLMPVVRDIPRLLSPTAGGKGILELGGFVQYIATPVSVPVPEAVRNAGAALFKASGGSHEKLLSENDCYDLVFCHLPDWVRRTSHDGGQVDAKAQWGAAAMWTCAWELPSACKPDVTACAAPGPGVEGVPLAPGFSGERKSVGKTMWHQAVLYTILDMTAMFFPSSEDGPGERVFYGKPPIGYAVLGYPVVAHYLVVEWVGKLLVSLASQPFFLGTDEHRTITSALPRPAYTARTALPAGAVWTQATCSQWTVHGGRFYKLVAAPRRTGTQFATMYDVYTHLATLTNDDGSCPDAALLALTARAAYGAHEVLVTMDAFAHGTPCTDADVLAAESGTIRPAVAAAVAWLASRRILYVDVRGPNVLKRGTVDGPQDVCLVDFDDARVWPEHVTSYEGYMAALRRVHECDGERPGFGIVDGRTFAARVINLADGRLDAFRAALEAAFDALGHP
mgnify:CR=1 FL=1